MRTPARCGTRSGYSRHRKRGEQACGPCLHARAAYQVERHHRLHPEATYRGTPKPHLMGCQICGGPLADHQPFGPCYQAAAQARR